MTATESVLQTSASVHQRAQASLANAVDALLALQNDDGHWRAELQGDSITNSEYVLMKWILRQEDDPRIPRLNQHLRSLQSLESHGGWGQYPGSDVDVSATVKAYVCLQLAGDDANAPHMLVAKQKILDHGGAEACNSFTNFYLACLGLIDWNACPAIPPEIIFLPRWSPFNLDHMSAWTRTMIMPLAICSALRPVRSLESHLPTGGITHLFCDSKMQHQLAKPADVDPMTWNNFFLLADRALKMLQQARALPTRKSALRAAEQWVLERADGQHTEGLGAIFPPMVYMQVALDALGYARQHPVRQQAERDLDALLIEDEESNTIRVEPCFSPVWDTGIALYALTDCGLTIENHEAAQRASTWLRHRENNELSGDWARSIDAPPAGWAFEYRNNWYPDVDDTVMVAMALLRAGGDDNRAAAQRGVDWVLALQNDDGGWAAFDRTKDRPILDAVPFADHNAMQDPSCADITGRTLECLSWFGFDTTHEAVQRALQFLQRTQEAEGCWYGRWGVNYIYGTWQAVGGLRKLGVDMQADWIQRAGQWLISVQQPDGSFGESADTYLDPSTKGKGPSTPSQTAWACMALQNIFGAEHPAVTRSIEWLLDQQITDATNVNTKEPTSGVGSWAESEFTGTGFPRVYYLRYHLYRLYFPIMAIARYASRADGILSESTFPAK